MADANMSYLYTIGGYATLIGVGYALYHVSTHKANRRGAASPPRGAKMLHQEPRKDDKKKKQRMESFASEAQDTSKSKARGKAAEEPSARPKTIVGDTSDDGVDNQEFAKQLAKAQEGTKLASKAEGSQREKSVKQSRANQMSGHVVKDKPSASSSTTGADADDDQSPLLSPAAHSADANGISDMLEPAPAGPSILRITDSEPKKQAPKAAKTPEKTETKKQRQNRKKSEATKTAREEAEKERKALEEKQRRTARIAEGRAAKDGSQFQAANGAMSAWTPGAPNGSGASKAPDASVLPQPLDTFEKPKTASVKQTSTAKSDSSWMSSLPSEEEQMEMLKDEADEWSTVQSKSYKKASKMAPSVSSADEKVQPPPAAAQQPQQPGTATKKPLKSTSSQHFGGSFSALTTNDDGAENAEEEWDV